MATPRTEVVYVCSPDREQQLFASVGTLFKSGSSIDGVTIFCISEAAPPWKSKNPKVTIRGVPPLFGEYFFGNKLYICAVPAPRIVFLDTDTVILSPLDGLWENRSEDFLARAGTANESGNWDADAWEDAFRAVGQARSIPMFNAGVLVFQNKSHTKIPGIWRDRINDYLSGKLKKPYPDERQPEQWALSLAVAEAQLSYGLLDQHQHAFGWAGEPHEGATIFHTGNFLFDFTLEKLGIEKSCPW